MILTLQTIPSTLISEIICKSDFEGIVLDTEHGCFNNETLYSCIQIITSNKKKCFVRFTDLNKQLVRMCLDAGIDGAIFSTVEEYNQGKNIVEYCTYPRYGGKRGCGLVRENFWGEIELAKSKPLIICQLETKKAVDGIEAIKLCGFDYFVIGPFDLSNSLGCVADWESDLYKKYLQKIYDSISYDRIGMFLPTTKNIDSFKKTNTYNPGILISGMDTEYIKSGLKTVWNMTI